MAVAPARRAMPLVGEPMVEWAVWYAEVMGWRVIPCRGKVALIKNWREAASNDATQIRAWWAEFHAAGFVANIAVLMGHGLVTLDVDAKHDGPATLAQLEAAHTPLPPTTTSITGSGGGSHHKLWSGGEQVRNKAPIGEGIDVQGEGSYIIVPPSVHPDTGQLYAWEVGTEAEYGPDAIAPQPLPAWLLPLLKQSAGRNGNGVPLDPEAIIAKGEREKTLSRMGGAMRRQGASVAEIRAAFSVMNQRMQPALTEDALDRVAKSMGRYAPEPLPAEMVTERHQANGQALGPVAVPWMWPQPEPRKADNDTEEPVHADAPTGWRQTLFTKRTKTDIELHANSYNMMQLLRYADFWQRPENALWMDVLTGRHMWGEEQIMPGTLVKISEWFGMAERMPISKSGLSLLEDCLFERCERNPRDRIALWLNGLPPWNGEKHLDTWLSDIANAARDPYTAHLGRRLLMSMIARALRPGCQYREVLVFGGPENIGKSHIVEALASKEFFIVLSMNLEAKEAHMMLRQAWLAELADLDSMNRTEDARMKAFITMEEDTYIPKYRNDSVSVPRRAIFVGTTNDRTYLKSLSGNTRFLPLWLPGPVDLGRLRDMREQLFAEAKHAYHEAAEGWWHMPQEIQEEARVRRESARVKSEYEGPLAAWLETTDDPNRTCWQDIAKYFLLIESPERWKDRSLQMQIGGAMRAMGYVPHPYRHKGTGKKVDGWVKKIEEETEEDWNF